MRNYTIDFSRQSLTDLPLEEIKKSESILLQLFYPSNLSKKILESIRCEITSLLPEAVLAGIPSAGVWEDEDIPIHALVTVWKHAKCNLLHIPCNHTDPVIDGFRLAAHLHPRTRAVLLFCEGGTYDIEAMLKTLREERNEVQIAGGIVPRDKKDRIPLFLSNEALHEGGILSVSIEGEYVDPHIRCHTSHIPLGEPFYITEASENLIHTIEHMPAADFLSHYLGEEAINCFTDTAHRFALYTRDENSERLYRFHAIADNGSIRISMPIQSGKACRFAFIGTDHVDQNRSTFTYATKNFLKNTSPGIAYLDTLFCLSDKENQMLSHAVISFTTNNQSVYTTGKPAPSALRHLLSVIEREKKVDASFRKERDYLLHQGPVIHFKVIRDKFEYISPNVVKLLGYTENAFMNGSVTPRTLLNDKTYTEILQLLARFQTDTHTPLETEVKIHTRDGEEKHFHLVIAPATTENRANSYIGYCIDITEHVKTQQKIRHLAFYDHVTGLPNRQMLKTTLKVKIEEARSTNRLCAVTFFDLDKFKDVNDTYGHSVGDKLLQLVANRIRAVLKPDDFLARIGGDEFILIHGNLNRQMVQNAVLATVDRILTLIHEPFSIDGKIAHISASIGTAIYGVDGEEPEDLIKHADMAMYEAKKDPAVHFKFYTHTLRLLREEELSLKQALKEAVRNRAFDLVYQPQVDIENETIIGAEALMRWNHPQKGAISPAKFIPVAEEMNLIVEIGEWLLEEVCHKIRLLQNDPDIPETFKRISINISPLQFNDPYFVSKVEKIVELVQIDTSWLEFELTEGIFVANLDAMVEKMERIKEMGITISLDDFGTGYSSLRYLKKLPIDTIKIDRAFIMNLEEDQRDRLLTSTIIQLSNNLSCKIVAEGVENLEQLAFLQENNCQSYQGFYFSKPVPFETFVTLLHKEKRALAANL